MPTGYYGHRLGDRHRRIGKRVSKESTPFVVGGGRPTAHFDLPTSRFAKVKDLGGLQNFDGREYALFRERGLGRFLLRGEINQIDVSQDYLDRDIVWCGHSHPPQEPIEASAGDRDLLKALDQHCSVIVAPSGDWVIFRQQKPRLGDLVNEMFRIT